MRSTDAQKRDATRVISARRVMFAALVICALIFGGTLLGAIPGVSGALSTSGDSEASATSTASGNSEIFAEKAFAEPAQSSSEDNSKEVSSAITTAIRPSKTALATTSANRGTPTNTISALRPMPGGITPIATSRAAKPSKHCETAKWTLLPASIKRPSSKRNSSFHLRIWDSMAIRSTSQ